MSKRIVIDLFDGTEELDALGPWEVLSYWTQAYPEDGWQVNLVTDDGLPRRCAKGLQVIPTAAKTDVPHPDLIIEPGGRGARERLADPDHLQWLRDASKNNAMLASVCTGALVLAAAGVLRERPATTYHACFDELLALDPSITPCPGQRWVDDGPVITAAGVSAGIDMALHLVGRLISPERARQVQDGIEYHPAPPTWPTPETITPPEQKTLGTTMAELRHPVPPFTAETAARKVQAAEDAWNTRDPEKVAQGYTVDTVWRNRDQVIVGRDQVIAFLTGKWSRELDYTLRKNLWAFTDDQIAVRFQYEWRDHDGQWWRSYGNEIVALRPRWLHDAPRSQHQRSPYQSERSTGHGRPRQSSNLVTSSN